MWKSVQSVVPVLLGIACIEGALGVLNPLIGIQLTEGFMMDPEASVSALVFHHPEARYFKAD